METNIEQELSVFSPITAGIATLEAEAYALKVESPEDREGYKRVKSFRTQNITKLSTSLEKARKDVKSFYLEAGRAIDARAKEIHAQLDKIASYCKSQESIVDNEVARKKAEKEDAERKIVSERSQKLVAVNYQLGVLEIESLKTMSDQDFDSLLKNETTRFEAEIERKKLEQAELERLRAMEAKAREEEQKRIAEQNAIIQSQQKLIEQQERVQREEEARRQAAEVEARKLAALEIQAKIEAEQRAREEAEDSALFDEIKGRFLTLEDAWVELVRLTKIVRENKLAF